MKFWETLHEGLILWYIGVFKTQSNIYDGGFLRQKLLAFSR